MKTSENSMTHGEKALAIRHAADDLFDQCRFDDRSIHYASPIGMATFGTLAEMVGILVKHVASQEYDAARRALDSVSAVKGCRIPEFITVVESFEREVRNALDAPLTGIGT